MNNKIFKILSLLTVAGFLCAGSALALPLPSWSVDVFNASEYSSFFSEDNYADYYLNPGDDTKDKWGQDSYSSEGWIDSSIFGFTDVGLTCAGPGPMYPGLDIDSLMMRNVGSGSGTAPVPEPATLLLLGAGLIGVAGIGRKKLFKKQ